MNALSEGDVIAWILIDPGTREWVMRCRTRSEGRQLVRECGGVLVKVVVCH